MLDFKNTKIAFARKSDGELRNAYMLFNVMKRPWIVNLGKLASNIALSIHFPIGWAVKPTLYKQFVGGETLIDCNKTVNDLAASGVKSALDFSAENEQTPAGIEATFAETKHSIENAALNKNVAFAVFKPSTLTTDYILRKSSETPDNLAPEEEMVYMEFAARFDALCALAHELGVRILVDAEDYCFQAAIDKLTEKVMRMYNKERAIVFATLQMYRWDRMPYLESILADAQANGYIAGIKFVRGAYMEEERKRAAEKSYPDPICATKADTDANFNAGVAFVVDNLNRMEMFMGTHNEESNYALAELIDQKGISHDDRRIYFAQLHGMSDHITFNLADAGYNVLKYVPYAKVRDVLPYLIRRAEENTSVKGQTTRELDMIKTEMKRRKAAGE